MTCTKLTAPSRIDGVQLDRAIFRCQPALDMMAALDGLRFIQGCNPCR